MRGAAAVVAMSLVAGALWLADAAGAAGPPVTFAAKVDVATGMAMSVAIADLNGDAIPDLVIGDGAASAVTVLLGDGIGGFGPGTSFAVGGSDLRALVVRDLDHDADLDLVVTIGAGVSVLLGDGTGHFGAHTDFASNGSAYSVAVGDVNGDTAPDLVTANASTDSVSVLLGDGAGRFGTKTDVPVPGDFPSALALSDLNGDALLDLVVSNEYSDNVAVLLGDGAGHFAFYALPSAGFRPVSLAVGDLNNDAWVDLVVADYYASVVSVLLGNGRGGFAARTEVPTGHYPKAVVLGDLNGDAIVDVATVNQGADSASVLLGDGAGGLGAPAEFAAGSVPWSIAMGDLDGDGLLDLLIGNGWANSVSVLRNTTVAVPSAPSVPTMLRTATPGHQSARISWVAPAWDGGSPVTSYVVTPYVGYFPLPSVTFASSATTQTVTGLTNGTTYRFKVAATNALGTSGLSKVSNPVTPAVTVPGAPTIGTAVPGDQSATVSWTAPGSDGGSPITGYVVTPYVGFFPWPSVTFTSTATTQSVAGLANGKQYRFRVQALNAIGAGGYSKVTNPVTPSA